MCNYCAEINWKRLPPNGRLPTCLRKDGTRLFYSVSIRGLTSGYVLGYKTTDGGEKPEQKPHGDDDLSHFKAQCFLRKPTDAKDSGLAQSVDWQVPLLCLFAFMG